jgi:hypothetical protein
MPDLYDRLIEKVEADEPVEVAATLQRLSDKVDAADRATGITTMDIMELESDIERAVMKMVMRDRNTAYGVPRDTIEQYFAERGATAEDALRALTQRGWLVELGEAPALRYRANLRARRVSGGAGLWSTLTDRIQ